MFLIHKHSVIQKWNHLSKAYEDILAVDVKEGDWIRGYNLHKQQYTKSKIVSKISLMARIIKIRTSAFDKTIVSEGTYLASTSGIWDFRSSYKNVKLFKKTHIGGQLLTPKPIGYNFEELDLFISVSTGNSADTMLVDDYIYVTEEWNGLQIKSVGSTGATEGMDAGPGTEPSSGSSESGS
jgi:hypothetical protein